GEVFETGYTDMNGEVTLYPSPVTMGSVDVTVTAHNCLPHQGLIEVGSKIGDANNDGNIDIADVLCLLNYLFVGGPEPDPWENGDVNCDGQIDIQDVVYLITYLFQNGPPPCP
ncbi:MAG: dockerin type I repeat-containing protein, partial [Candidatus Zixiibacteriota bacterium]